MIRPFYVGNNPCAAYTKRCDWECLYICKMQGTERYGEGEEVLEECNLCGAKILPTPYAPHKCRDMEEGFSWDDEYDEIGGPNKHP